MNWLRRLSFKSWEERINRNESRLKKETVVFPVYYWHYCPQCRRTHLFEVQACTESFGEKPVNCPGCGTQFGEIPFETEPIVVGSVGQNLGEGRGRYFVRERRHYCVPEQFKDLLLQHLGVTGRRRDSVNFIRDWKPPRKLYVLSTQEGDEVSLLLRWIYCTRCEKTILFEEKERSTQRKGLGKEHCPRCGKLFGTVDRAYHNVFSRNYHHAFIGELKGIVDGAVEGYSGGAVPEDFLDLVLHYVRSQKLSRIVVAEDIYSPFRTKVIAEATPRDSK